MATNQLPDDLDILKAMVLARDVENARLTQVIKELRRHRFGRRVESLPEDQLLLELEEAEQIEAAGEEESERADLTKRRERVAKRQASRVSLPAHLPNVEMLIDIEDHGCPRCCHRLHRIDEEITERLDIVPAQLRDSRLELQIPSAICATPKTGQSIGLIRKRSTPSRFTGPSGCHLPGQMSNRLAG